MPRANRCFLPEHTWHITHRCHKREFLLKFKRDRMNWKRWLFIAKKRFGLCVLNYIATSNHIHLLVVAKGHDEISKSMQLVAGRTAQEYNARKKRKGAFWEDRYHATAIDTESYLFRCMVYIDLNMVRTGVVSHPSRWDVAGYTEIQYPPSRYRIIDQAQLMSYTQCESMRELKSLHQSWHAQQDFEICDWSGSIAIGSRDFVGHIKRQLGIGMRYRKREDCDNYFKLKETNSEY